MNSYLKVPLAVCLAATFLTAGVIGYAMTQGGEEPPLGSLLQSFSSYEELAQFLEGVDEYSGSSAYYRESTMLPTSAGDSSSMETPSYSTTNVQVAGVDEADIVKTDGEYIYIASYNKVTITKAYPPAELANVTVLDTEDLLGFEPVNTSAYVSGVFLGDDRLVVILTVHEYSWTWEGYDEYAIAMWGGERALASVFDTSDIASPELLYSYGVSGFALTSRMIGDYLYLVASSYIWRLEGSPLLPLFWEGSDSEEFDVGLIYYDPETRDASAFMNLLAVDVRDGDHEPMSVLSGYASTVYMSLESLYLSIQKWSGLMVTIGTEAAPEEELTTKTTIYKVAVDELTMVNVARGDVKGWLLNQFSMDENEGYLRVATTTSWSEPENGVYVLNSELSLVGSLEGLAPTERIYSARFLGDTLYLVTFRQVDPFFVIDLTVPSSPEVLGELKIPGFSSYLHPVDENHVLGIGSENGSVKLSLFDVSDPTNPVEKSKYLAPQWSYSTAQYDHKAFLFDFEKELLVIPIQIYSSSYYPGGWWAGAFVFKVSTEDGISLRGSVAQDTFYDYDAVIRALYIGDTLYTVSYSMVKATSLVDLSEEGELIYMAYSWWYYGGTLVD